MATMAQEAPLRLLTHDSFTLSEAVLAQFEQQTGFTVEVLRLGDAGQLVNQAILTRGNPLGDVLYGVDTTFLTRALDADLFAPYAPSAASGIASDLLDGQGRVTPINFGDVCLNYDAAYFATHELPIPDSLADLADPGYNGLLVVQNPAVSSPGLAFLAATVSIFGEQGAYTYLDFWRALVANDVLIADDWTDAYYGAFSGSAGSLGDRPLVVSYASSPPAEVYFADPPLQAGDPAPTGAVTAPQTCFRQIEYAGVLAGAANPEAAAAWIDFMLSPAVQEDVPLQMFVFPIMPGTPLPDVFVEYAALVEEPILLTPEAIEAGRDAWITAWTDVVLR